jgi:hypothetical protein
VVAGVVVGAVALSGGGSSKSSTTPGASAGPNVASSSSPTSRGEPAASAVVTGVIDVRALGAPTFGISGCARVNEFTYRFAITQNGAAFAGQTATFDVVNAINPTRTAPVDGRGHITITEFVRCELNVNEAGPTVTPIAIGNRRVNYGLSIPERGSTAP